MKLISEMYFFFIYVYLFFYVTNSYLKINLISENFISDVSTNLNVTDYSNRFTIIIRKI